MLTLKAFEEAAETVQRVAIETKLIYSDFFSEQTGNKVYLKPENLQKTGAYKLRGAYYKISTLTDEERARGLITASAGNHAQGVAYAAQAYGCGSLSKVASLRTILSFLLTYSRRKISCSFSAGSSLWLTSETCFIR